jgi:putative lipoic acid-binding regulatory protein
MAARGVMMPTAPATAGSHGVHTLDGLRPEIHYPCWWTYRVICTDATELRAAVGAIVGSVEHTLTDIGASASGRYHRFELVVQVRDEAHRNQVFAALGKLAVVRFVL